MLYSYQGLKLATNDDESDAGHGVGDITESGHVAMSRSV